MKSLLLFVITFATFGFADESPLKAVLGKYAVIDWNLEPKTGFVTIFDDETGIGFRSETLAMATNLVPLTTVKTPKEGTTVTTEGNTLSQEFVNEQGKMTHVEYEVNDGYLRVRWSDCANNACRPQLAVLTTGKAPGELVDTKSTLAALAGGYVIQTAGGKAPEGGNNEAEIDITSDPNEAAFYFPYCLPTGCDLGYIGMRYDRTLLYRRSLGVDHFAYEIFKGDQRYSWESQNGKVTLRNYQYVIKPNTVCLEHAVTKAN
jgi:hypothetical protein